MPLFIRDEGVSALADELVRLTKARTKTEAVRAALQHEIERVRQAVPLRKRLERAKAMAREIGMPDPDFDMQKFTDEMWGGI